MVGLYYSGEGLKWENGKKKIILSGFANDSPNKLGMVAFHVLAMVCYVNKEACCYQFCISVCISERSTVITL